MCQIFTYENLFVFFKHFQIINFITFKFGAETVYMAVISWHEIDTTMAEKKNDRVSITAIRST